MVLGRRQQQQQQGEQLLYLQWYSTCYQSLSFNVVVVLLILLLLVSNHNVYCNKVTSFQIVENTIGTTTRRRSRRYIQQRHGQQHGKLQQFYNTFLSKHSQQQQQKQQGDCCCIIRNALSPTTSLSFDCLNFNTFVSSINEQPTQQVIILESSSSLSSSSSSTTTLSLLSILDSSNYNNNDFMIDYYYYFNDILPILLVGIAIVIGLAANGIISKMLQGEQGLGAYLSDGSGYKKSKFKPIIKDKDNNNNNNRVAVSYDPLPWLKLPQLDYVDVAGQERRQQSQQSQQEFVSIVVDESLAIELERLRLEMYYQIQNGKLNDATITRTKLETLMKDNGIDYTNTTTSTTNKNN